MPVSTEWIGARLKEVGRTQADLARRLRRDRSVISKMIRGLQPIRMEEIEAFCVTLKMTPAEFIERTVQIDPFFLNIEKYIPAYSKPMAMKVLQENVYLKPDIGFLQFDGLEKVMRIHKAPLGIRLEDESMLPLYPPGSIIIVDLDRRDPTPNKLFAYVNRRFLFFGVCTPIAPGVPARFMPVSTDRKFIEEGGRMVGVHHVNVVGEVLMALEVDQQQSGGDVLTARPVKEPTPDPEPIFKGARQAFRGKTTG